MTDTTKKAKKAENYTAEQTASLVAAYAAKPTEETVKEFAEKFGKGTRSIVMKLVREKVYQKKEYETKTGEKPTPKADLADGIGRILRLKEPDVTSLEKASKAALSAIMKALAESAPIEGTETAGDSAS